MLKYFKIIRFSFKPNIAHFSKTKNQSNNCLVSTRNFNKMPRYEYPKIRRDEMIVDNYHGMEINDPYRWLEDPDSEDTKKFVEEQNKLTNSFLDKTKFRENIRERY